MKFKKGKLAFENSIIKLVFCIELYLQLDIHKVAFSVYYLEFSVVVFRDLSKILILSFIYFGMGTIQFRLTFREQIPPFLRETTFSVC